jgi:hypothetical protein
VSRRVCNIELDEIGGHKTITQRGQRLMDGLKEIFEE